VEKKKEIPKEETYEPQDNFNVDDYSPRLDDNDLDSELNSFFGPDKV